MIESNIKQQPGLLIAAFFLVSIYFSDLLTIENIKANKIIINEFIETNYIFSVLLFFLSCAVFVNSPVPLAAFIKVLGGYFFGFYLGLVFNIFATVTACIIGFLISRYTFKDIFEKAYYNRLKHIENEIEHNGIYYFLTLRLVMIIPYFIINITAGLSRISFKNYVYSTTIGVIPASIIYANGGSKLEKIDSISELFQYDIIISLALIGLLSLIPVLIKKHGTIGSL
ncbi:MAG: TVP38/TMEM64 family protein [Gammaproteobacteria bacterium]